MFKHTPRSLEFELIKLYRYHFLVPASIRFDGQFMWAERLMPQVIVKRIEVKI